MLTAAPRHGRCPSGTSSQGSGRIAQLVEQLTLNQRVLGSSPSASTIFLQLFIIHLRSNRAAGGSDCDHFMTWTGPDFPRLFNLPGRDRKNHLVRIGCQMFHRHMRVAAHHRSRLPAAQLLKHPSGHVIPSQPTRPSVPQIVPAEILDYAGGSHRPGGTSCVPYPSATAKPLRPMPALASASTGQDPTVEPSERSTGRSGINGRTT
jgi:hypothetical protein